VIFSLCCVLSCSDIVALITSGPILAVELQAENAIQRWQDLLGPSDSAVARASSPSSIRARYGTGTHVVCFINLHSHSTLQHGVVKKLR